MAAMISPVRMFFYNVTLMLIPLSGGVYVPFPGTWVGLCDRLDQWTVAEVTLRAL